MGNGYVEVSVVAGSEAEEGLCDFLFSEGALGLVTEDLPGEPSGMRIRASFAGSLRVGALVERLKRFQASLGALGLPGAEGPIEVLEIPVEDWGRNWKKHFKPLPVGRHLVVAPPWEDGPFPENRRVVRIDPAMAFGTGHHATTRMCLEALEAFMDGWPEDQGGPVVLDVGTGTGILAIAAASLGAARVVAVDTDPQACDVARKNLALTAGTSWVHVLQGGIEALGAAGRFDLVLANLDTRTLCPLLTILSRLLAPGGRLIVSGIPIEDEPTVTAAVHSSPLRTVDRRVADDWLCLTIRSIVDLDETQDVLPHEAADRSRAVLTDCDGAVRLHDEAGGVQDAKLPVVEGAEEPGRLLQGMRGPTVRGPHTAPVKGSSLGDGPAGIGAGWPSSPRAFPPGWPGRTGPGSSCTSEGRPCTLYRVAGVA
ncbi:MAG: 50S ribosomal protein L11 methyltransferase [candidate division NC10 bacterium]|nr:50S ribosomal protein L11 methyltransferase [candidate division NC10 bacterium]